MKKKTKYSSRLLDFFVTAVLICVALTFSWFFYQDLNRSGMRTDKTPVATIKFKNRIAQRKYIDRVVWERLSKTSPVYDGDIIRTEDLAQAVIEFDDHSSLELNENTMLQIYYSLEKGLRIAVDGGQIALEAGENSNVTLTLDDGSVVNVDSGASVAAKSTPAGARNLEVKSGTAQIQTETGTVQALESGQSVSVQENGEIVKNPVTVTSIPNDLKIISTEAGEVPVKLEWNKDSSAGTVRLQTSKTKNFSVIEEEKVVTGTSEEIHVPDGKIYWRIFTDDDVESAATGKISVEAVVKARNISPASSAEFRYRNARPSVNFMWQGSDSADYYSVVVSSTPDMNSVVFQKETEATSLRTDSLEEGTYWWKVMPYYSLNSTGFAGESEITSFTVVKNEQIAPPQLFVPSDNAEITWKTKPSVSFSWKSEIKDASYTLLVSRSGNFDSPDAEYEVSDTRLAVDLDSSQFPDSSYYWKVIRHSSDEDDIHKESDVRSFKIAKYVPQDNKLLYPPQNFNTEKAKLVSLEFMWKLSDDYKDALSVIQFSNSADFKDIALERETDRQGMAGISLREGSWWWRVGAKSEDGTENYTGVRKIVVLRELEKPRIKSPEADSQILSYSSSPVTVGWEYVPGADYYNVKVMDSKGKVAAQKGDVTLSETHFVLPPDSYTCRIQAVAKETSISPLRTGEVSSVSFTVREPENVVQNLPEAGSRIKGLDALRKPVVFSWKTGKDRPESYELVLKKRQKDGSFKIVQRIPSAKTSVSLDRLTEGTYSWKVKASTAAGIPLDSTERSFTVDKVPELSKAVLTVPSRNFVINADYLRKNRKITFEWKKVPDATSYNFVLYRKQKDGTLRTVYSKKNLTKTSVVFDDLASLELGEFSWSVTAFVYAKDGFEERRSKTSSSVFKISFDEPGKIEAVRPGIMYSE